MHRRENLYRVYVADALCAIGNLNMHYSDLLSGAPEDGRSAEEIISGIKSKLSAMSGE